MPSLRGRLLLFILRNRHWLRFRLRPEIVDWNQPAAILRFRQQCEEGAKRFGKIPAGITVSPVTLNGLPAEWIASVQSTPNRAILWMHGGGYVSGSCADHRIHVAKFVHGSGVRSLLFEYRLAPEHPFPAALEDSLAAYRGLLAQGIPPARVVFAGDSAGGGLGLAALLAARDQGLPLPAAVVAISPWTDLKCTGESYQTNAAKCLSPAGTWTAFSRHYTAGQDAGQPWISPLYGDLRGLPPMLIHAGGAEILRDDAVRFAAKAKAAGVNVTLRVGDGLFHCYPVCAPLFPEASEAMADICDFIKNRLNPPPVS